ncbi:hypothetical protein CSUI_011259 [Cystoisospora suis]|uniref:Uncharacterized protein n=1 Tax=Cystoisospora suis TaxID=483139 RepID=A0A2C6JTE2_9APIC|nr:hypothetical protein CSUI_011259 [Cystoisospora suis]
MDLTCSRMQARVPWTSSDNSPIVVLPGRTIQHTGNRSLRHGIHCGRPTSALKVSSCAAVNSLVKLASHQSDNHGRREPEVVGHSPVPQVERSVSVGTAPLERAVHRGMAADPSSDKTSSMVNSSRGRICFRAGVSGRRIPRVADLLTCPRTGTSGP